LFSNAKTAHQEFLTLQTRILGLLPEKRFFFPFFPQEHKKKK
jgi:hypothetical protein